MSAAYAAEDTATTRKARKADKRQIVANIRSANLAEDMDDADLARLGAKVVDEYKLDEQTRVESGWVEKNERALKLAMQAREIKNTPWPNAANVKYPLVAVAAIQFNARAYPAIIDGYNVVKGKALGKPSDEKTARADRIGKHMSYQLLQVMDGWEEDTDKLLLMLPITGTVFRKTYFDPSKGYNCSYLIPADKLVVNYWAKDLESCPRVTELVSFYPHEIEERIRAGLWLRCDLGIPPNANDDELAPHDFLEQHRLYDLDEDGYPEPYICTVHKETMKVVRIVARYDEAGVEGNEKGEVTRIRGVGYYTKYSFLPSPDGSIYDVGFGHLLDAINETVNTIFNQLLDAGTLQNVGGGFIGSGVTLKPGATQRRLGEWKHIEVAGADLRANLVPVPITPPSAVLFQLLGMLIEAARDITATKDILTGETQGMNQPVGTTLAMIEQGLKVFTAIYKRVHRSLKAEYAKLYRLNRLYLKPEDYFQFEDDEMAVAQKDYADDIDVIPVSDPTVVSDMQKLMRAEYLGQFRQDPLMNGQEINKRRLEAASIQDIKSLFAEQPAPDPKALIEGGKLHNDTDRLALETRQVDLAEKDFKLREAQAIAANTNLYASALTAVAGIGQSTTSTAPVTGPSKDGKPGQPMGEKKTETINTGLPGHAASALALIHGLASSEVEEADGGAGEVQQGDVPGLAGPPADPNVPQVPDGQPSGPDAGMGQGSLTDPAAAGESPSAGPPGGPVVG